MFPSRHTEQAVFDSVLGTVHLRWQSRSQHNTTQVICFIRDQTQPQNSPLTNRRIQFQALDGHGGAPVAVQRPEHRPEASFTDEVQVR